ncbi:MAG: ABC transporter permease [Anaerolineales bacterium]|nr:ABC transporter permease [Anaerolineales bacterium]
MNAISDRKAMFTMKSLYKMSWMEAKLFMREPISVFFTLAFPLIMLFIFGTIYSNVPVEQGSGIPEGIGGLIPAFMSMVIGITGLMGITITMATYRENGILRRLRATPVTPLVVLTAQVAVVFTMTALGALLLVVAGMLVYQVRFEGHFISMASGFVLSSLSFFSIGFILAGTLPTARTAQIVALVLLYPMLILSGAAWPRELMPTTVQKIADFLPLTYVVNLLSGLWAGSPWENHLLDIGVLAAILLLGVIISARIFRWE